jgi:hypothetical protein
MFLETKNFRIWLVGKRHYLCAEFWVHLIYPISNGLSKEVFYHKFSGFYIMQGTNEEIALHCLFNVDEVPPVYLALSYEMRVWG